MKLSEVFNEHAVQKLLESGEVREIAHPDGRTRMWTLDSEIPSTALAAQMKGVIFRDGEVLARPLRRFQEMDSEGFPETHWANLMQLGFKNAVCTRFLDGHSGVMFHNSYGVKMIAGNNSFVGQPWIWACGKYRERFRDATWPREYSPNFVVVHPEHVRTMEYREPQIFLVGLVHLKTGDEASWADVREWGKYNDMRLVDEVKDSPYDFPYLKLDDRGVVMRWDFEGATLRVGFKTENFKQKNMIEGLTPADVCDMLQRDLDVEILKKHGDKEFAKWLELWRMRLHSRYWSLENRVVEITTLAENVVPPVSGEELAGLMEFFPRVCEGDTWALPVIKLWLEEKSYEHLLWAKTKTLTQGIGGWRE